MALTRCPRCGKPAVLVDSQGIGRVETPVGEQNVTERRIVCAPPAGCGADETEVLVFWRIDLYQGPGAKRTVRH